jgi:hypothetical protein
MSRKEWKQLEAQMRFLRTLPGNTRRNKQRNVDIKKKLNQENRGDEIRNYQQNWLQRINRMENNRLRKLALRYEPQGKRDIDQPRRRWKEQDCLKANELRTGPTTFMMIMIMMMMMMKLRVGLSRRVYVFV